MNLLEPSGPVQACTRIFLYCKPLKVNELKASMEPEWNDSFSTTNPTSTGLVSTPGSPAIKRHWSPGVCRQVDNGQAVLWLWRQGSSHDVALLIYVWRRGLRQYHLRSNTRQLRVDQ